MAIDDTDRFPPESSLISGASTLVRNGIMQSDMDAQFHRILNLDTSNLILDELHTQGAVAHKWFNSYDQGTHSFGISQPAFIDISGALTFFQQGQITRLGQIIVGEWRATPLLPTKVPTLDAIRAPINPLDLNSKRIVNMADPIDDQDAVTLRLFNAIASGLHPKAAVRVATTENMVLATLSRPVDGVTLVDNDRVLVKQQAHQGQNGIYLAHPGAWTRTTDSDTCDEMEMAACFILEGDVNANSTWFQTTPIPANCVIGSTNWVWSLLSRSGTTGFTETGVGLDHTGDTIFAVGTANRISVGIGIDIDINYEGQDSIGVVGTIFQGTWESDLISGEFGGTGVNNSGKTITLLGNFQTANLGLLAEKSLTFLLSDSTSLVLPSLGTLATLNGNETLTNKHISASQIDSGVILISHGGTSANTAVSALKNLLPDVTGNAGKSLHTDGADVFYWA